MTRSAPFTVDELRSAPRSSFVYRTEVRFQDVDGAAIVFFSRFFEYFHDGYAAYLRQHGILLANVVRSGTWLAPLTHAEADYLSPLRFGDTCEVELVRAALGRTSLRIGYRVRKAGSETICAVGQTVHVMVDGDTFRPREIPPEVRQAFEQLGC